jgi:uridine kinase
MQPVKSTPIIIFEGIHGLYDSRLRDLMDLKIFVLTPDDIRLSRRSKYSYSSKQSVNLYIIIFIIIVERDIVERGRQVIDVLN